MNRSVEDRQSRFNGELPRFPEFPESLPARPLARARGDANHNEPERTDAEILARIAELSGAVMIGIKPIGAARSRETGIAPGLHRAEMLTAREVLKEIGVEITHTYANFRFVGAKIDLATLGRIRDLPFVDYVEPAEPMVPQGRFVGIPSVLSGQDTSWGVKKTRAQHAWSGYYGPATRGQYSSVTIIDTGVDSVHLWSGDGPAPLYGCAYVTPAASSCYDTTPLAPIGERGHGAHIAGIVAGRDDGAGFIGIANDLYWLSMINVCGPAYGCPMTHVAAALDATVSGVLFGALPRHIVNMSLGNCANLQSLSDAVSDAAAAGILLVAAAGNTPSGCGVTYPARYSDVIAVSGTLEDDAFAASGASAACNSASGGGTPGSESGSQVDLAAPFSAWSMWTGGTYLFACGTSASAPAVTGIAALLWTLNPSWTAANVRSRLESTAIPYTPSTQLGHGRVDALRALYGYTPLVVQILGPNIVTDSGITTWSSASYGGPGAQPFSYEWRYSTVSSDGPFTTLGTGSDVSRFVGSTTYDFWLRLDVTRGNEVDFNVMFVDVDLLAEPPDNPCAPYVCLKSPE